MTDFGTCWSTPDGQDLSMPSAMASGNRVVAEAVLRRWSTPRGQLVDDPNYGFDLTDLISDDIDTRGIARAQQQAAAEAQKDERVQSARVTLTFRLGVLTVDATIGTANGPFRLVAQVSNVTTKLLLVSP